MKLLYRDPEEDGMVILNPPDLASFVANSARKCATVVIHGKGLVASTVSCSNHDEAIAHAGIEYANFDPETDEPEGKTFLLMANRKGINCELWFWRDTPEFPYDLDKMQRLHAMLVEHPRLKRLAANGGYEVDIVVYGEEQRPRWKFNADGVHLLGGEPLNCLVP